MQEDQQNQLFERLVVLEVHTTTTQKAVDTLLLSQAKLQEAMQDLAREVALLAVAIHAPHAKQDCAQADILANTTATVTDLQSRLAALERAYWKAIGIISVIVGLPAVIIAILNIITFFHK